MELLNDAYAWVGSLPPASIYGVLFAVAYLENVVPPIPGDVGLVVGGMIAAGGAIEAGVVIALATVAGGLGFVSVYGVGRRAGEALLAPDRFRRVPKRDLMRALAVLGRRGYAVVLANRFLPGLRAVIGLAVGMSRMRVVPVAVLATLSAGVWSALLVTLGVVGVDQREVIAGALAGFERVGVGLLAALAVALAVWWRRARWRRAERAGRTGEDTP